MRRSIQSVGIAEETSFAEFRLRQKHFKVLDEIVSIVVDNRQIDFIRKLHEGLAALFPLSIRMDRWVKPETGDLVADFAKVLDRFYCAGCAAYVEQDVHPTIYESSPSMIKSTASSSVSPLDRRV